METVTLDQLNETLEALRREIREMKREADPTAPMTAGDLCVRWKVEADSPEMQLKYLARRCLAWGVRPMRGTRGWEALYPRQAVLHAEAFAAGTMTRRRFA